MNVKAFKYLSPVTIYVLAFVSFYSYGWLTWSPVIYAWLILPLTELVLKPNKKNMNAAEEELAKNDKLYDYLLYIFVVLQFAALFIFLKSLHTEAPGWWEIAGRISAMGLLCVYSVSISGTSWATA